MKQNKNPQSFVLEGLKLDTKTIDKEKATSSTGLHMMTKEENYTNPDHHFSMERQQCATGITN